MLFSGGRARNRTGNKTSHEENELSECKEFSLYGNEKRTINEREFKLSKPLHKDLIISI